MLSKAVQLQRFESVARGNTQIAKHPGLIQKTKFSKSDILNIGRQSSAPLTGPDQFCFRISKALDHG